MTQSHKAGGEGGAALSVCLFCGSSDGAQPDFQAAAAEFGRTMAAEGARLVYGGGGVGLMGAAAKAAHGAGGGVLGVMPDFLRRHEVVYDAVETIVVKTMHDRKRVMFEQSDAFAIFPGGVGTLEEAVELMSWRRLDLHRKPMVFLDLHGFWRPFFALMEHTVAQKLTPAWLPDTWRSVQTVAEVLPTIRRMQADAVSGPGFYGYQDPNAEVAFKL
jgi:uncharacterized protein (TIGR00730 family)